MRGSRFFVSLMVGSAIFTSASVALASGTDAGDLTIRGMKLYEDAGAVRAKLVSILRSDPINSSSLAEKVTEPTPRYTECARAQVYATSNHGNAPAATCVSSYSVSGDRYSIAVGFVEDFPDHPGRMRVTRINYHISTSTKADMEHFYRGAFNRYGDADIGNDPQNAVAGLHCSAIVPKKPDSTRHPFSLGSLGSRFRINGSDLNFGPRPAAPIQPHCTNSRSMSIYSGSIELTDDQYASERHAAIVKAVDSVGTQTMRF